MLRRTVALRRRRTVDRRCARWRGCIAAVGTRRHSLFLSVSWTGNGTRIALFNRRRPRRWLHISGRRRRCCTGRLVDRILAKRSWCALGNVRMVISGVILGPLRCDRSVRLRLSVVGCLIGRLVRRGEYFRAGERCPGDWVQLLVHWAGRVWLLRWLHLMQVRRA